MKDFAFGLLFSFFIFLICGISAAQTFEKLTPYSNYSCITISTGDTYVGTVNSNGYDTETFADVKKIFNKQIKNSDKKITKYKDLLEQVIDEESTPAKKFLEAINDLKSFYKNEKNTPPPPKTRKEKISVLKKAIEAHKTIQKGYKTQLSALKDCQQRKNKHKIGFVTPQFIMYGGFAGYFIVGDADTFSGYYCVKGAGGYQVLYFQVLPCAGILPECVDKDGTPKVGLSLCTFSADHAFSEEEKIGVTQYLNDTCGGYYEIKQDPFTNGNFTPCKDVFGDK